MIDELTPISAYIAHEMNTNAHGRYVRRIAELNAFSGKACIAEYLRADLWRRLFGTLSPQACLQVEVTNREGAILLWTLRVMQNAEWDHKPKISARFHSAVSHSGFWYAYGSTLYFYDIWSNVHYGYVGTAAGFSGAVLLDGAGLEQIGSDLVRRRWPTRTRNIRGLRAYDDASDRNSIALGMHMYRSSPAHVSPGQVLRAVLATPGLTTKPITAASSL